MKKRTACTCQRCGKNFEATGERPERYCGPECRWQARYGATVGGLVLKGSREWWRR